MSNSVLWISSGYGEKPSKVILTSFAVILFYAMIYTGLWSLISSEPPVGYSGFGGSMVFSLESFTTLVLGGGEVDPNVVKFVGYSEGFLGAFLIALFVFTLTRSVHR
jgi:hypothetical protein